MDLPQSLRVPPGCPLGAQPLAYRGDRVGVLVLHGFTGSPWEVRPLADDAVALGHSVAVPVLAGHATALAALNETTWQDWLHSAEAAHTWLATRCDRVHVIGLSMGALLALLIALRQPPALRGRLVLLAPALVLAPWQRRAIVALGRLGWPTVLGKDAPQLANHAQPPCYSGIPLRATQSLLALQELVARVAQPLPALVLHGAADQTIPCEPACSRARALLGPAARIEVIPGAGHLLPRTEAANEVAQRVRAWLA